MAQDLERFRDLTFADFRRMAVDDTLSPAEKIGFPDSYRAGLEAAIAADIVAKLPALDRAGARFLDIGPGCSELPRLLLARCAERGVAAVLVDAAEMLDQLPDGPEVIKLDGAFPDMAPDGPFDAILAYSVLQYVDDPAAFLAAALDRLAPGGALLLGDLPNVDRRRRFFASPEGRALHLRTMGPDAPPPPDPGGPIDDAVVEALVTQARAAGCEASVVPLREDLPLAGRREDVLVMRP
jgi:SAM-dependent methyltransferase